MPKSRSQKEAQAPTRKMAAVWKSLSDDPPRKENLPNPVGGDELHGMNTGGYGMLNRKKPAPKK